VSSPNSSSGDKEEITVLDNPAAAAVTLEVKMQVLPQTEDFGQLNNKAKVAQEDEVLDNENIRDLSQNLLEDDKVSRCHSTYMFA
jgi:hypothetical protein